MNRLSILWTGFRSPYQQSGADQEIVKERRLLPVQRMAEDRVAGMWPAEAARDAVLRME